MLPQEQLIKVVEHNGRQIVNARELHEFLNSKQQFANWIQNRIQKYGFVENQDYLVFNKLIKNPEGGRPIVEYGITLNMAKELGMLENNSRGRKIRQYFIDVEERLKAKQIDFNDPDTVLKLVQNLKDAEEENKRLQQQVQQKEERLKFQEHVTKKNKPKIEYDKELLQSESAAYTTTHIAEELGMDAPSLNRILQNLKVQYKHSGTWVLYAKFQDKGYTKKYIHPYFDNGVIRTSMQTGWTEKGREFIHSLLNMEEKRFGEMPFNEFEKWEKETNSVVLFYNDKGIAFQKTKNNDGDTALVIMVEDDDIKEKNIFILVDEDIKRLAGFL